MSDGNSFPKNFFWGAATSSHQIEGGNENDWTRWEKRNAEKLAEKAKERISKRASFEKIKSHAEDPENYISGKAANHKNRFKEDIEIASNLGINSYRFSIEWSRIEPEKGEISQEGIEFYHKLLDKLEEEGIKPFITLHHFTSPKWFVDRGGWESKTASKHFQNYIETVVEEFGDRVEYWITVNEPHVYALNSFLLGRWPPEKRNPYSYFKCLKNMEKFHQEAYEKLKSVEETKKVGISSHNTYFYAEKGFLNHKVASFLREHWNHRFIKRNIKSIDFIGLNYYKRRKINKGLFANEFHEKSDMGWELYPEGLYHVLKELDRYDKPIIITEHGLADSEDEKREKYLKKSLKSCQKAMKEGVNLQGYLHWSLLDNFEWDSGFWPRFGLIEVDYDTYERKVRESAETYSEIIKNNELPE